MSGKTFPVRLIYEDRPAYAKGGLVDAALAVKRAGRYGDTEIIHINRTEYDELVRQWGKPTINPDTGLPEFFLGKIGKILGKVAKIALPIAAMAIPGIGPAIGGALGLSGAAAGAVGSGLLGAASGALGGGGLKGALTGGLAGGLGGLLGPKLGIPGTMPKGGTPPIAPPSLAAAQAPGTAQAAQAAQAAGSFGVDAASQGAINTAAAGAPAAATQTAQAAPNFWNRNFLGTGIKNKFAVPALGLGALALGGAFKQPKDVAGPTQEQFFGNTFSNAATPAPNMPGIGGRQQNVRPAESYQTAGYSPEYQYFRGYAKGGDVDLSVRGPGDGRDDQIDARLSDGEYVMDAETVAMLGNGSTRAGAKALDGLRVSLRKHKGRSLARGRFSAKAKRPEQYMRGHA